MLAYSSITRLALASLALVAITTASADNTRFTASNAAWQEECGGCHVAYPPQLLNAASWRAVMAGLDKHFGTDASIDAANAAQIGAFLERNAGRPRDAAKPTLRITETRWFRHEHDEVPSALWKHRDVKTAANCRACHTGAERGDYSEASLRLPK